MKLKEKGLPPKYERTYLGPMNAEETEMLYRIVCLGVLSGNPTVRAELYKKVGKAYENVKIGRSWICTRDIILTQQEADGKEKERAV